MERIGDLCAEIGELLDLPLAASDYALCADLAEVHRAQTVLAALKARLMAAADTRRAYADDGSKTAAAWLAKECNAAPAAVRREALVGRRLRKMPSTDEAFATGAIGADQVLVLTKLASSPRAVVAISFPEAEELLFCLAKDLPFDY
jgi:hypothetical protein